MIELKGSVLGRMADVYDDQEKQWIYQIAMVIRDRDWVGPAAERQDMGLYVRAAGSLYELAKRLEASPTRFTRRSLNTWLCVLSGHNFRLNEDAIDTEKASEQTAETVVKEIEGEKGQKPGVGTTAGDEPVVGEVERLEEGG